MDKDEIRKEDGKKPEIVMGQPEKGTEQTEKAAEQPEKTPEEMSIEEILQTLDALIGQLEREDGSLEDAFRNYEKGMKLIKCCSSKIETIEKEVLVLSGQAEEEENGSFI